MDLQKRHHIQQLKIPADTPLGEYCLKIIKDAPNNYYSVLDDNCGGGGISGFDIQLVDCESADQNYVLPEITLANNHTLLGLEKYGRYKLTVQPTGTDSVATSGPGAGIESRDAVVASVILYADLDTGKWHMISNGGVWMAEGLVMFAEKIDALLS